ncbi:MAG: hypothetical protein R3312_03385 [Gammaproteobacteria bacterium]|jgi:hypothetical protein|nr:hypothetical protein [Gammaproteobacteria bacterium]
MSMGTFTNRADVFHRNDADAGYRVAYRSKRGFEKGVFDEELTYGEARKKAEELAAKDDTKTFWPEMIMDPNF